MSVEPPSPSGTTRRRFFVGALALASLLPATVGACTLNVQPVVLGSYDFRSSQPLDGVGYIEVACDTATSYRISLSPGQGSFDQRIMSDGGNDLAYNLYADNAHLVIWGDGGGGSATVSGSTPGAGGSDGKTVYASAPAGQNPRVGNYSDAIVVTLEF